MYKFQKPHILWKSIDRTVEDFVYGRHQKEREACIIALFGVAYSLLINIDNIEVRLVEDREPVEAELKIGDEILGFQIAMAVRKNRNPKKEYQNPEISRPYRPVSFEEFAGVIETIVVNKINRYGTGKGLNLLIYSNMSSMGLNAQAVTNRFKSLVANFDSIWLVMDTFTQNGTDIITGHSIIKIAPDFSPGFYSFTDDEIGLEKISKKSGWIVE